LGRSKFVRGVRDRLIDLFLVARQGFREDEHRRESVDGGVCVLDSLKGCFGEVPRVCSGFEVLVLSFVLGELNFCCRLIG
jgi:hypothetical protein